MSAQARGDRPPDDGPLPALADRFGYLLKHAQQRLAVLTGSGLAPLGITGRECAVLIAIDDRAPLSQQEVARRMNVDRTTMVALIDDLEHKGLVQRRQDPDDRRKNVVILTGQGRDTLRRATAATAEAERRFLGSLSDDEAATLRKALQLVAFPEPGPGVP
ncbi:MAG TPA: MarR family transcriptional regulator [Streptosporangiaceae bacterium]|nr:MarR family transcriptional regulator [Streptosporangiaceae bacterium]